ncbi:GIY-YIG nuclease family protein [Vibrio sp. TRT 21S02]|uniref:GIY-YIG nuclease family protein n=1 Tax=unclassified Vibrio TaxID=2614977 RepID=UPI00349F1E5D
MSDGNSLPSTDWHVYLVRNNKGALYCGITTDVERRFEQHVKGIGAKALKGKGPLSLVWHSHAGSTRSVASKIEYRIKRLSKTQKEQLVSGRHKLNDLIIIN